MSEWTSMSVKAETKDRFDEKQPEGMSKNDFLGRLLDEFEGKNVGNLEPFGGEVPDLTQLNTDKSDIADIKERLEEINIATRNKRVMNRIDDLEAELTKQHEELLE